MRRALLLCLAALFTASVYAQDSQSLGDVARQQKQQKDGSAKDSQSKDSQNTEAQTPKAPRVYTNDEIPEKAPSAVPHNPDQPKVPNYPRPATWKAPADQWKSQIQMYKDSIAQTQAQIDQLNDSIHYASNCVSGCAQLNERQNQKQQQVEMLKARIEEMKKQLEAIQEMARQQGYGSAVYDP